MQDAMHCGCRPRLAPCSDQPWVLAQRRAAVHSHITVLSVPASLLTSRIHQTAHHKQHGADFQFPAGTGQWVITPANVVDVPHHACVAFQTMQKFNLMQHPNSRPHRVNPRLTVLWAKARCRELQILCNFTAAGRCSGRPQVTQHSAAAWDALRHAKQPGC